MLLKELMTVVGKLSPILATYLGTPVAGVVCSLLGGAFGVNGNDLHNLSDVINATPDAQARIAMLEQQHGAALGQMVDGRRVQIELSCTISW